MTGLVFCLAFFDIYDDEKAWGTSWQRKINMYAFQPVQPGPGLLDPRTAHYYLQFSQKKIREASKTQSLHM